MKRRLWLFLALLCSVVSGCTTVLSLNPLYKNAKEEKPYLDPRIEGEWILDNFEDVDQNAVESKPPCKVKIAQKEKNDDSYAVEFACPDSDDGPRDESNYETRRYDLRLVKLGTATFFDAQFQELKSKEKHFVVRDVMDSGIVPAHLLGEVWAQQDFVRFSPMSSEWIDKNWPEEHLTKANDGRVFGATVDVLTNPTDSLRAGIAHNAESAEAFGLPMYLCRPGADCDKMAIEDELARAPNNKDVLVSGGAFYAKRGDATKAVALQRRVVAGETDENEKKAAEFDLGSYLLLAKEFGAAREELASAKEPNSAPSREELVVRSYFLDGNYEAVVKAAKSEPSDANLRSADSILLKYFALYRIGKRKDAEAYLREQAATFIGPAKEHLYLLEAMGRVSDNWDGRDLKRSAYYKALENIRKGEIETAKVQLENLLTMRPKNDLISMAAEVELKRLKSTAKK